MRAFVFSLESLLTSVVLVSFVMLLSLFLMTPDSFTADVRYSQANDMLAVMREDGTFDMIRSWVEGNESLQPEIQDSFFELLDAVGSEGSLSAGGKEISSGEAGGNIVSASGHLVLSNSSFTTIRVSLWSK